MAEALFRKMTENRDDFEVGSAGVATMDGDPASTHTADIVRESGASLDGFASRQLTAEMLDWATHVVGMTTGHLQTILDHFPEKEDQLFLATEFCADDGIRRGGVPDPIGMGRPAYEATRDTLLAALPDLLSYIDQTTKDTSSEG